MQRLSYSGHSNPVTRFLGALAGIAGLVVAAFLGVFVLAAVVGIAIVAGVALYLRIWWLRRRARRWMRENFADEAYRADESGEHVVIEGEYHRVSGTESRTPWEEDTRR